MPNAIEQAIVLAQPQLEALRVRDAYSLESLFAGAAEHESPGC